MKKVLLPIILLMATLNVAKAQTDFCKDIKKHGAADVAVYNTPFANWKGEQPVVQLILNKFTKGAYTTILQGGLSINTPGNGESYTEIKIEFEDGDKLTYPASKVDPLPKGYGTYGTQFFLSSADMDKFITKKIKTLTMCGVTESNYPDLYKTKIMAYAACYGNKVAGSYNDIAPGSQVAVSDGKAIESFMGVKFGTSPAQAKSAIIAKGGKLNQEKDDNLYFDGITFADRPTDFVCLSFVEDKLYKAVVYYPIAENDDIIPKFNIVIDELSKVYGTPRVIKDFVEPYRDGDGFEVSAIKIGKAHYTATWKSNNNNTVLLQIIKDGSMALIYTDAGLSLKKTIVIPTTVKSNDY